jgi:hypothetical protein
MGLFTKRSREKTDIHTVEDIIAHDNIVALADLVSNEAGELKALVVVIIDKDGYVRADYAGVIGRLTAKGLMDDGKLIIDDGGSFIHND